MSIAIIKYNAGNIFSVKASLNRLGVDAILTNDKEIIQQADKVIFPGVGEASSTMNHLRASGMDELIKNLKQPVLGICLGMQLLCKSSEEGDAQCLGIFDVGVKKFVAQSNDEKIPHMGWNTIHNLEPNLFPTQLEGEFVYFVHSYYVPLTPHTVATTNYIEPFSAAIAKDNFFATQFHPEKSGDVGEKILLNFLQL